MTNHVNPKHIADGLGVIIMVTETEVNGVRGQLLSEVIVLIGMAIIVILILPATPVLVIVLIMGQIRSDLWAIVI